MKHKQIIQAHPAPWHYVGQNGNIFVFDALGKQVELFTLLDFAVAVTMEMAQPPKPAETSPQAPYNQSVTTD